MLKDCSEEIIEVVITAAIDVHRELGPGLLETVYEKALMLELSDKGLKVDGQVAIPVNYRGRDLGVGYRADIVVEGCLLLELKTVDKLTDVHIAQIITYLKFIQFKRGYLLNFNEKLMKHGIKRISI